MGLHVWRTFQCAPPAFQPANHFLLPTAFAIA